MASLRTCFISDDSVAIDIISAPGVVCHDAGGANQILAMLDEPEFQGAIGYFEGPAKELAGRAAAPIEFAENLPGLLGRVRMLVTGTGWGSRLEHNARDFARQQGIRSIAILDHWTNYQERFIRDGRIVLPDELWVVDEYALRIANQTFAGMRIELKPDRYAEQQADRIAPLSQINGNELLYLLEPARSTWGRDEAGEFQALRYFLEQLPKLGLPWGTMIRLRPHPSDASGKYDPFLREQSGYRIMLDNGDLAGALSRARWVAGCQTYAMTLALKTGRTVYCTLPPWAPPCQLPHRGLVHLQQIGRP